VGPGLAIIVDLSMRHFRSAQLMDMSDVSVGGREASARHSFAINRD
jgi:hypothetical protein